MEKLPLGKLPPHYLEALIGKIPTDDPMVIIGPGTGLDCSVLDLGNQLLVFKTDPISLTSENIGRYAVEINTNDIVTTGADPKWMLNTILLPENSVSYPDVEAIMDQLVSTSKKYGITIIGGHTEITSGINRPIISSTMIGLVDKDKLITPLGSKSGDLIFLTKEIAIETVSILANDFSSTLDGILSDQEMKIAKNYAVNPGISVFKEAILIRDGFGVTGMHDPTEGGLASALWEMSIASKKEFFISLENIPISPITQRISDYFAIKPINSISSGALLFTAEEHFRSKIIQVLEENSIPVSVIGVVGQNGVRVMIEENGRHKELPRPLRDEITKVFPN